MANLTWTQVLVSYPSVGHIKESIKNTCITLTAGHMTVLPSGVKKLQTVSTSGMKDCDFQERTNVARAEQVGITGLTGEMDKSDYAYTSGMEVRIAMNRLRHEQREVGWPESDSVTGWFSAEKADGNCVVFDLTGAFLFTK